MLSDVEKVFRDVWDDGMLADSIATQLTCTECEALAGILAALGAEQGAQMWIQCHAEGDDDEDDLHYKGGE